MFANIASVSKESGLGFQIKVKGYFYILFKVPYYLMYLRYVIFDEVHNIGAEGNTVSWEHSITMVPCPLLALSATVANPKELHSWLQRVEDCKKDLKIGNGR